MFTPLKILLCLLLFTVSINAGTWHKIDPYKHYTAKDFHLKKNVGYMEIRTYAKGSTKAKTVIPVYRRTLRSYGTFIVDYFKILKPEYTPKADIRDHGNAFMMDRKGKMWRIDEVKDIIDQLGTIDRVAEFQLVLWLYNKHKATRYKKTKRGYELIIEYNYGGEYGSFRDRAFIDKRGRIKYYKMNNY